MNKIILFLALLFTISSLSPNTGIIAPPKPIPEYSLFANSERACLASAIFYEANTQKIIGQRAVMDVILHRAKTEYKSICQVVKAKNQFEWWPKKPIKKFDNDMKNLLTRAGSKPTMLDMDFKYFFHKRLRPAWARNMECVVIQDHKFCKIVKYKERKYARDYFKRYDIRGAESSKTASK